MVCVAVSGLPGGTFATLWQHELGRRNRAWGRKSQSKSRLGRFHDTPLCTSRIHPSSTITIAMEPSEKPDRVVHLQSGCELGCSRWPKENSGANKESAVVRTKSRDISATRHRREWAAIVAQEREAIRIKVSDQSLNFA